MTDSLVTISQAQSISIGHRVYELENAHSHLHGHTLTITFHCSAPKLDSLGRTIDLSEINNRLCSWLDQNWNLRMLIYSGDPWLDTLMRLDHSVVRVPFNPTIENLALHLLNEVGPAQLRGTSITLSKVEVQEVANCTAVAQLIHYPPTGVRSTDD